MRFSGRRGFTLIELLIVMTVIGILASVALPSYQRSMIRAREAVLLENLYQLRNAADAYFADQSQYPDSLDDLVYYKYLREVPRDPMTKEAEWECLPPEASPDGELPVGGCYDFRSLSNLVGLNGLPYNEW